ncbi:MAG: ABC transporter permease [bacterium]
MRNINAVMRKEFIHIVRDKRTLILIIMMPLLQLLIYGFAVNTDVKHLSTGLFDEDRTALSRRLADSLEQSQYFDITFKVESYAHMRKLLDRGYVKTAIHIPPQFAKELHAGRQGQLQMLIDGTDANPANVALSAAQAVVSDFSAKEGLMETLVNLIDFRPRLWYNPDLKSTYFFIPGLVGLLIQFLIPMITASAVVREKERGNIEQLRVSPLRSYELMAGKLIPYTVIGIFVALLILGTAHFLFSVPIRGNPIILLALTFIFILVCLGIGLFASTVAENQQQSAQIVMFFAMPSILLSGFIFPREGMPRIIYYLSEIIPLTHYLKIVRGIVLKGLGVADVWPQVVILTVMAVIIISASVLRFRKRT